MMKSHALILLLLYKIFAGDYAIPDSVVVVNYDRILNTVDERFLSFSLDCSLIGQHWQTFNASDPTIVTLAKGLSPAILRLGGTVCDYVVFNGTSLGSILYAHDWDKLVGLSQAANLSLLYDVNVMLRNEDNNWDPTNFMSFLNYNKLKGNKNLIFELGNEPNNFPSTFKKNISAEQLAKDFSLMRYIIDKDPFYSNASVVGPDVGNPYLPKENNYDPETYMRDFLKAGYAYIDALTWHHYYLDGKKASVKDFINPDVMNNFEKQVEIVKNVIKDVVPGGSLNVWLGETSNAENSGAPNISNTYVAGFLWMDKLGVSARSGYKHVVRQTFYGGWYSLLDSNKDPNPDYWLSLLYKRLVGSNVLNVTVITGSPYVRAYAHCTAIGANFPSGSITIYAMNLNPNSSVFVRPNIKSSSTIYAYLLEPKDGNLQSTTVLLNNVSLSLVSGQLPSLSPMKTSSIFLKPLTFGFFVVPENLSLCIHH